MSLSVVFMGTPEFSVPTLRALHEAGHEIRAVYCQPSRPAGRRGLAPTPSPVEREARRLGLEVRTPVSLKDEAEQAAFSALAPDIAIVVAYGLILPKPILEAPRHGALNGHGSLLPRWRGAAPIQRAIEAGDTSTGMMVMAMETGLDTGPIALTHELTIDKTETAGELQERLSLVSADLMVEALASVEAGTLRFESQAAIAARTGREVAYARKIDKAEAAIDWSRPASEIARRINAFSPFPGAWTMLAGERLKLLRAIEEPGLGEPGVVLDDRLLVAAGMGALRLLEVQRAGGRPAKADEFLRGLAIRAGARLGAA